MTEIEKEIDRLQRCNSILHMTANNPNMRGSVDPEKLRKAIRENNHKIDQLYAGNARAE